MELQDRVGDWRDEAPDEVKRKFAEAIHVRNLWGDLRNRAFQMIGRYDGAMDEACKAISREEYAICEAIVAKSDEWYQRPPSPEEPKQ